MKTKSKVNGANAVPQFSTDVTNDATNVLKTLLLLGKPFGMSYLTSVLKGDEEVSWMREEHKTLETFGCLNEHTTGYIKNMISIMIDFEMIGPGNAYSTVIKITKKGEDFLENPSQLKVHSARLKPAKFESLLAFRLGTLRKNFAEKEKKPGYQIFSDFTLNRLVRLKPLTVKELREIPGIGLFKAEKYGSAILDSISRTLEARKESALQRNLQTVKSPTYQQTRELFIAGNSPAEIAKAKGISESTIKSYLEKLHLAGEINLKPWIEENIDNKALYKGAEYFKQVEHPRMKEAYEVLGLDYDILRMCKLYVSDVQSGYDEVLI